MAYELNGFGSEFIFAEGEPYDASGFATNEDGDPISVWSALGMMSDADWNQVVEDVFPGVNPDYVDREAVLAKIREHDTVDTIRNGPIRVYVDSYNYVTVYPS